MESSNLITARNALSKFESHLGEEDAIRYLSEGLDRLDEIVMEASNEAAKARAIGDKHVVIALRHVKHVLASGNATEPELKNSLDLMLALKEYEFGDTDEIKGIASDTAMQLFKKHLTGYSDQEKLKVLERMIDERKRRT
jgi:hypothetical protein